MPTSSTHRIIPYKYVVVSRRSSKKQSKQETVFEFVRAGSHRGIVNRALVIPDHLKGKTSGTLTSTIARITSR